MRSHVSNNGEGTDTVKYTVETDDLKKWTPKTGQRLKCIPAVE